MSKTSPEVSQATKDIISQGGQIMLSFDIADGIVEFKSRWHLAELIEAALIEQHNKTCGERR